jgi:hypothetical protein
MCSEAEIACCPLAGKKDLPATILAHSQGGVMLGRNVPKENVQTILENVSFIVFNYDRCLEFFLVHALRRLYQITEQQAQSIVDDLHIVHPYGAVPRNIPFGNTGANFAQVVDHIKTYTEQMGAGEVINAIATELGRAHAVIFLGFAYHNQNMTLLRPAEPIKPKQIFGTAFGMSDADVEVVSHDLASFFCSPNGYADALANDPTGE